MSHSLSNRSKLTKRIVESITPDKVKRTFLWDTEVIGFCVRIYPSGRKTYFFQYRNQNGVTRKVKIGVHGNITTEQARETAQKITLKVGMGNDPSQEKEIRKNKITFFQLVQEYLELHAKINKRAKGYREDKYMLDSIILKRFASIPVKEITSHDILNLHKDLKRTPYMANRVRALLSKIFSLAIQWGWCSQNPVEGVQRYQEIKRVRWLNDEELERLLKTLDNHPNQTIANAIRLLLLTGSRRNEVLSATWNQLDLEKGTWTKPAHTTKQKKMEHLPLSAESIELLKDMKKQAKSSFLFPGKIEGEPLKDIKKSWITICKRANLEDFRLHDLRHTHASHLVSSGLSLSIVGKLLGHTQVSTTQRYAHLADEPLRQAAEFFGKKVSKLNSRKS